MSFEAPHTHWADDLLDDMLALNQMDGSEIAPTLVREEAARTGQIIASCALHTINELGAAIPPLMLHANREQ